MVELKVASDPTTPRYETGPTFRLRPTEQNVADVRPPQTGRLISAGTDAQELDLTAAQRLRRGLDRGGEAMQGLPTLQSGTKRHVAVISDVT